MVTAKKKRKNLKIFKFLKMIHNDTKKGIKGHFTFLGIINKKKEFGNILFL